MIRRFSDKFIIQTKTVSTAKMSSATSKKIGPLNLPLPSLDQTLSKFLKSVRPLVTPEQLSSTENLVKSFRTREGPRLQSLLEKRANERPNWLEEWWLQTAYLAYRDPVVLFSSPGLVWPQTNFANESERLQYTAVLIAAALEFNAVLDRREVKEELSGENKLDMEQYYRVFGTTRIPLCMEDTLRYQDTTNRPNNIIVMINNHAFSLQVLDDQRRPLPTPMILDMLEAASHAATLPAPPVGLLTTERRDHWARAYALLSKNVENVKSLNEIDRSLFVVCLDAPLSNLKARNQESKTSQLLLHGGGHTAGNAANRWYDKTIQFVVGAGSDGVGIAYEHSPAEGGPIGVLADFVIDRLNNRSAMKSARGPAPTRLKFEIPREVEPAIQAAAAHIDQLALDLDIFGFKFSDFGKNELKTFKTSPDSFVQIAIQFAFFKVHGKPAAQYESGTLRRFIGGRTDVIRTCSEESLAFCRATGPSRLDTLRTALSAHKQYATDAVSASGVDRHLLGLKLIAKENGLQVPALFSDPSYLASSYFQLSTSNVGAQNDAFMVYAPLVADGYACCYNIRNNGINFGTSAWRHNNYTDVGKFQAALVQALREMRDVLASGLVKPKL